MPEKLLDRLREAFVSNRATSVAVSRTVKAGELRKLASRLYTRNLTDDPASVVRRNLWQIVGGYFPGGLIADRTALENAPAADGSVCLDRHTRGSIASEKSAVLPALSASGA